MLSADRNSPWGRLGRCFRGALGCAMVAAATSRTAAQVVRGSITSTVGARGVPGAVVLLLDSALTPRARALTTDSGAFVIGAGAPGRYRLRIMRIGFRPSESPPFDLRSDTTVDLALTDIPVILPALTTRDRNDCRLHPDTSEAGRLTFALWDQARTALLAAAITLERAEYRFSKLQHYRIYDMKEHTLRDIDLRDVDSRGSATWTSLPAEALREKGYTVEDDTGMTFFAPDLDVLLSPYFTEEHCFRLTNRQTPDPSTVGIDFEPASRPRHTEIRGTLWLDSTTKELRSVSFAFVNLPISSSDTLLGGNVTFLRLATGAWILPSWSIRMPTPVRPSVPRTWRMGFGPSTLRATHWRLSTDVIRIAGGDLRAVRRGDTDSVLWRRPTGTARLTAYSKSEMGEVPAGGAIVRLAGSPYGAEADVIGHLRFEQVLPGTYLFEATTPVHDLIEASSERVPLTVREGEVAEARVPLKPLAQAAAEVCKGELGRGAAILVGFVTADSVPVQKAHVAVEYPGGDGSAETRDDGYFKICNVPTQKLMLVRASRDRLMVTTTIKLNSGELVRQLNLQLKP